MGRRSWCAWSCGFVLAACAAPTLAQAQPAKPAAGKRVSPEDEARARFHEGIALADASDHEAARLKFNQAWALLKSPVILYNLALSEQLSGHLVEALEHYRLFGRSAADPKVTELQRKRAAESANEIARSLGQIRIEAPAGARVSVDGQGIESIDDPIPVLPGRHDVESFVDGKSRKVTVDAGAGVVTRASLVDEPPSALAATSAPASPAPSTEPDVRAEGGFWSAGRVAGASVAGVGLVGLGLGLFFHGSAADARSEAAAIRDDFPAESRDFTCFENPSDPRCGELRTKVEDEASREDLRTGFLIGGGALVLGGAVVFLASGRASAPSRKGVLVVPTTANRYLGLTMTGSF